MEVEKPVLDMVALSRVVSNPLAVTEAEMIALNAALSRRSLHEVLVEAIAADNPLLQALRKRKGSKLPAA